MCRRRKRRWLQRESAHTCSGWAGSWGPSTISMEVGERSILLLPGRVQARQEVEESQRRVDNPDPGPGPWLT